MLTSAPPIVLWAIPVFVVAMALEAWSDVRDPSPGGYVGKDTAASLSMGLGYLVISIGWKVVDFALLTAVFALSPFDLGWSVPVWIFAFFADDLAYYWYHRLHHEVRFMWASHVTHHSSERYNLSTALRQTWVPFTGFVFWLPLAFIAIAKTSS